MKYVGLIGKVFLALLFGLSLLITFADDRELASVDLYRPATLLSLVTSRLQAVHAYVRDFRVRDLIDTATAGFRARIRHEPPTPPPVP